MIFKSILLLSILSPIARRIFSIINKPQHKITLHNKIQNVFSTNTKTLGMPNYEDESCVSGTLIQRVSYF